MKEGAIYRSFTARDGRKVTLRAPKWGDLDDMLHFINSLVEEKAMILMNEMQTRDSEITWISTLLSNVEKDKIVAVVAEVEGKFAGSCEISPKKSCSSPPWHSRRQPLGRIPRRRHRARDDARSRETD